MVILSSLNHKYVKNLDLNDLNFDDESYTMIEAYNKSKLCNVLFGRELAERMEGTGEGRCRIKL